MPIHDIEENCKLFLYRAIRDDRLDRACLKVLAFVADADEPLISRNKIANAVGISPKSVSNYLGILRRCGYVRRFGMPRDAGANTREIETNDTKIEITLNVFLGAGCGGADAGP